MRLFKPASLIALALGAAVLVGGGTIGFRHALPTADAAAPAPMKTAVPADCDVRLDDARSAMAETANRLASLATAGTGERCAAYREHLSRVAAAGETFGICLTGFHQAEMSRQAELSQANWEGVLADACAGR